jgi:integrase
MASVAKRRWTHNGKESTAWVVRFTDHKGVQRQKTFAAKKEADKYRHQIEADAYAGVKTPVDEKRTVASLCETFLRFQEERVHDGRIGRTRQYQIKNLVDRSIKPLIGMIKATDLTTGDIESFYSEMIRKQMLAPATAKDRVQDLQMIVRFAIERGHMRSDPVAPVIASLRNVVKPRIRVLNLVDARAILQAVETRPKGQNERAWLMIKIYIHLAASCGMRLGEINGLRVCNVDLDAGVVRVRNSLTQFGELKGPKTAAGNREVAMTRQLAEMLATWTRLHYLDNPDGLLFRTRKNTRITNGDFHSVYWEPVLRRAGLDKGDRPHFHALRHFFASWLLKNGMALPDVAAAMGHANVKMTLEIYAHCIEDGDHRLHALRRFGDVLLTPPEVVALPAPTAAQLVENVQGHDMAH